MTGAAFGIAGESDTVERLRTPSVVSIFRFERRAFFAKPHRPNHAPFDALSSRAPASTARPLFSSSDTFDRLLPSYHLLTCTRALGFRPWRSKGGTFSRCPIPTLAGRAATRAVLGRLIPFSRPFTTSPRASRHPLRFSQRAGSRPLPTRLVKSAPCHGPRYFPSGDVGAPHLLADERGEPFRLCERAVYQRTSIPWAWPPWSDETPPFTRRSATPRLATNERFLLRASPCPRAFCGLPHG